jgi:stringent starvation protein B
MKMRSNRPYLLRAFFDWIVDNDCTPYVVVDAHHPGVEVPQSYVTDGQIVLNVAPRAVSNFILDLEILAFSTRFGGMPIDIQVPVTAVVGIYSQEREWYLSTNPLTICRRHHPAARKQLKNPQLNHLLHRAIRLRERLSHR